MRLRRGEWIWLAEACAADCHAGGTAHATQRPLARKAVAAGPWQSERLCQGLCLCVLHKGGGKGAAASKSGGGEKGAASSICRGK